MAFNTLEFLLLLAAVVILYYVLPKKARNPLLLVASYGFYAYNSVPLVLFLVLCTLITFVIALRIESSADRQKKNWVTAGVVLSIGVLAFYKYLNFLFDTVNSALKSAEFGGSLPHVSLVAPLGISFIIFQTVSYLIDVYRGTIPAERSLFRFALYGEEF